MSLSIVLAARGRPDLLRDTIERTLPNIELHSTKFVVALDDDDKWNVPEIPTFPQGVIYDVRPREDALGDKANRVLEVAPADVYLYMVDYAPHITPGFDSKIIEAAALFPDNIGVVYNSMATSIFPNMNAATHRFAELCGGFYPKWFPYWFTDHWFLDIHEMIGRPAAVADVKVDVLKRPGTRDFREPKLWATLYNALAPERRIIAERILNAPDFQEPEWRKRLLRNHWPLIEQRSERVNEGVRRMGNAMNVPADARYNRLRAKAVEILRQRLGEMQEAA